MFALNSEKDSDSKDSTISTCFNLQTLQMLIIMFFKGVAKFYKRNPSFVVFFSVFMVVVLSLHCQVAQPLEALESSIDKMDMEFLGSRSRGFCGKHWKKKQEWPLQKNGK